MRRDLDPSRALARPGLRLLPRLSFHKLYFDEIYDALLVRPTRALARGLRRVGDPVMDSWIKGVSGVATDFSSAFRSVQTGLIRDYASYMVLFVVIFTIAVMLCARGWRNERLPLAHRHPAAPGRRGDGPPGHPGPGRRR